MLPLWYSPKSGTDNSLGHWCQCSTHTPQRVILSWRYQSKSCLSSGVVGRGASATGSEGDLLQVSPSCNESASLTQSCNLLFSLSSVLLTARWKDMGVYMYCFTTSSSPHSHMIWWKLSAPSLQQEEQVSDPLSLCQQCGVGGEGCRLPFKNLVFILQSRRLIHLPPLPKLSNFHTLLCSKRCLRSRVDYALLA